MKHACYVGTRNMYEYMMTSAKSLVANSDVDEVHCLIEDDYFPFDVPDIIKPLNVSKQTYFKPTGPNYNLKWTYMTLMRAALPYIFPDIDIMFSLDDDTICIGDVSDVWDIPIRFSYFSAAREPLKSMGGEDYKFKFYGQCGVALYNLKKLRDDGMADKVIEAINAFWFDIAEQDVFNMFCQGTITPMDPKYNQCNYTEVSDDPRIFHYAFIKDWSHYPEYIYYNTMSWEQVFNERENLLERKRKTTLQEGVSE